MKTIYKYPLDGSYHNIIPMHNDAQILCVQVQDGIPCLWALVDPATGFSERHFETFGTGHVIPDKIGVYRRYIGTYQLLDGHLVFHVFEKACDAIERIN
jgi:hypothetical protein